MYDYHVIVIPHKPFHQLTSEDHSRELVAERPAPKMMVLMVLYMDVSLNRGTPKVMASLLREVIG